MTVTLDTIATAGAQVSLATTAATITIRDDDAIRVSIAVAPSTVGEESGEALVYTVTSASAPTSDVTVSFGVSGTATFPSDYTVAGAASFTATTGTVVIQSGTTSSEVRITPVDDTLTEGSFEFPNESVILTLVDSSVEYNLDPPIVATANITDDEAVATAITVNLNDGVDENVELIIDGGSYVVRSTSGPATEFFRRSVAIVSSIIINAGDTDADTVSINFLNGNPVPGVNPLITPSGGVTVNGGTGGNDTLTLDNVGSSFTTHTYDYTNANDGTITLSDGTDDTTINYTGLEPVTNDGTAANAIFNLPTTDDDASLIDAGTSSDGLMTLMSNSSSFESTTFVVPTASLTINGGAGNDTIVFASADDALVPNDPSNVSSQDMVINGDAGNDYVWAKGTRSSISVYTYSFTNGTSSWDVFSQSDVTSISVNTGDGHDRVYLTRRINQSATIDLGAGNDRVSSGRGADVISGGAGNDVIYGNNGNDNIDGGDGNDYIRGGNGHDIIRGGDGRNQSYGDNGHDILVGGANYDYLDGGRGRDILIGGGGSDWLDGANSDDILIGGSTIYDNDDAALSAIRGEWTRRASYNSRVNTIRSGSGSLGGIKLEANTTVLDDGARDYLVGNRGRDWYFGDLAGSDRDRIFRSFREVVDQLP